MNFNIRLNTKYRDSLNSVLAIALKSLVYKKLYSALFFLTIKTVALLMLLPFKFKSTRRLHNITVDSVLR